MEYTNLGKTVPTDHRLYLTGKTTMTNKPKPGTRVTVTDCYGAVRRGIVVDLLSKQFTYSVKGVIHYAHYTNQWSITK